ncbi:heparan-sulfate 6-O-sulfotransferase 2 [Trichonephila inaurata madagascariensis]|uniref:Heparan-sulfate 6-O-sulfotransferase n=1 Tax=Trichonephila inaurata madagascariensis TaxID=2747483 RepID=A0A8X6WVK5_9ARAC|nr:heparan-sulfate 6-O-sulfotransferase 2 [Trichonephila inaurata madagascariensis]
MQLYTGRFLRYCTIGVILMCIFVVSFLWYTCSNEKCLLNKLQIFTSGKNYTYQAPWRRLKANREIISNWTEKKYVAESSKLDFVKSDFNIKGSDVIVFLHIQNTGGSVFARHMVEDLALERPCRCKKRKRICQCYRPNNFGSTWFFSRYTAGWKCGVHPDWSELSSCVDRMMDEDEGKPVKRRYFFITVLRDPVKRFLSEFWHVRQGQSWSSSRHWCDGVEVTENELPACFDREDLSDLTLEEFMKCKHNLAINRQTRMLADLALAGCYNSSLSKDDRDLIILTSAKINLHKMSFLGLSEFPKLSQYMFEETFGMKFKVKNSLSHDSLNRSARKELFKEISAKDIENIKRINYLDIEFYHYAKELLFYRFEKLKQNNPHLEDNFEIFDKSDLSSENWAEKEDFIDNLLD